MVQVQKVFNILSYFFFVPLVFIGPFFLLNLTLVVIKSEFTKEHEENKNRKRRMKFILKKVKKLDDVQIHDARSAFVKAKVKNNKIRFAKMERRDSDDSRAESRHRHNLNKLNNDQGITKNFDSNPESRAITAKSGYRPKITMRPLHGITGFKKKRVKNLGDPITEEMSNSELSLMNQNNIFYPSNISASGAPVENDKISKDHNAVYLKKGKGKIRMEGMYGISKLNDGKNELGSNSDLLDDISLSNDEDGEVDNGSDDDIDPRDSEIMLPLDSSLSENSRPEKKNSNGNKNKDGIGSSDKGGFLISEGSFEFDENDPKLSPDKIKKMDRKNTNYFTGTNFSSNDNEIKTSTKKNFKNNSLRRGKHDEKADPVKFTRNTKITSKIEGFSNFEKTLSSKTDKVSKLKDFNIKNIIFRHIARKQGQMQKRKSDEFSSEEEGDDETEEKKQDKQETEIREEDLIEMEANKILVVKKGKKIMLKRDVRFDPTKDTAMEEVLQPVKKRLDDTEKSLDGYDDEKAPKTTIVAHSLMREMKLNEIVLEGKAEEDEEENKENEEMKPGDSKNADEQKDEDKQSDKGNNYLEKFKFPYRSNIVATGTISLVVTLKDTESYIDIPNPCAESYGAIIADDISSEDEEESRDKMTEKKAVLRRNDTLLPGGLLRQNTSTSKGLSRRAKTMRRALATRNNMKRRAKDEEEYSEENILKRIKLDIPVDSEFYKRVDIEEYKKEQEEEDKLNEGEDDMEADMYYDDDEEDIEEMDDIFLDREIDFDKEVKRA